MSITGQGLIDSMLNLLNEASTSDLPEYGSSDASSPTYTAQAGMILIANNMIGRVCTTCYAWRDIGTLTFTADMLSMPLAGLATNLGGTIWCPQQVAWNGVTLKKTDEARIAINYPTILTDAPGTPVRWYQDGQYNVGLAPSPSVGDTLTVWGYAIPPAITAATLSTPLIFMFNSDVTTISYLCCAELARKSSEDQLMKDKVAEWEMEGILGMQRMYNRLGRGVREAYFTAPPSAPAVESNLAS